MVVVWVPSLQLNDEKVGAATENFNTDNWDGVNGEVSSSKMNGSWSPRQQCWIYICDGVK